MIFFLLYFIGGSLFFLFYNPEIYDPITMIQISLLLTLLIAASYIEDEDAKSKRLWGKNDE